MSPARARGKTPPPSRLPWLILVLVAAGAGLWWFWFRNAGSGRPGGAPTPSSAACWSPSPLNGTALARSKQADFTTVEQLSRAAASDPAHAFRVQAELLSYQIQPDQSYLLRLGSMVDPHRTLNARIPAGHCVANSEDAALFDELREDLSLRFGPATTQPVAVPQPAPVVVIGLASPGPNGIVLEPVLDFRAQ